MRIDSSDRDFGFILVAAVRYAVGRRTYAPSLITEWIKAHADEVHPETLDAVRRDLDVELKRDRTSPNGGHLGHDCDRATWLSFHEWLCARSAS